MAIVSEKRRQEFLIRCSKVSRLQWDYDRAGKEGQSNQERATGKARTIYISTQLAINCLEQCTYHFESRSINQS